MRNIKLEEDIILIDEFLDDLQRDFDIKNVSKAWDHVKQFVDAKDKITKEEINE